MSPPPRRCASPVRQSLTRTPDKGRDPPDERTTIMVDFGPLLAASSTRIKVTANNAIRRLRAGTAPAREAVRPVTESIGAAVSPRLKVVRAAVSPRLAVAAATVRGQVKAFN